MIAFTAAFSFSQTFSFSSQSSSSTFQTQLNQGLNTHPMSNASQAPAPSDSLALVNSFYGPGATACWYLTCLACLISWTIHPRKRIKDSITNDMIALIIFPTVASAHLITQVRSWPPSSIIDDKTRVQMLASLAASLIIIETYLFLCVVLLSPGLLARVPRRLSLLGTTGIFCVASETYLYFSLPETRHASGVFERSFIIDSLPILVMVLVLASTLLALLLAYIYFLVGKFRPLPDDEALEDEFGLANKPRQSQFLTFLASPVMFVSFLISSAPEVLDLSKPWTGRHSFLEEFFPRTESSIMDLDQAVALFAGLAVLGFSLYSAAD